MIRSVLSWQFSIGLGYKLLTNELISSQLEVFNFQLD